MTDPVPARRIPYDVELEAGKRYAWCACGLSKTQPFCDASHKDTDIKPMVFTAKESKTKFLCACKQTKDPPFCDGSHGRM